MTDYGRVPAKFAKESLTAEKNSGKRSKCAGRVFFDAQVPVAVADLNYTERTLLPPNLMRRRAHPRKKVERFCKSLVSASRVASSLTGLEP